MSGPTFFTVVQTRAIVAEPQESGAGTITFTASPTEAESTEFGETFVLGPVEGRWLNGQLCTLVGTVGLQLVDNQQLNLAVGALTYTVTYNPPILQSFSFAAPGNGAVVDLSTVERIA